MPSNPEAIYRILGIRIRKIRESKKISQDKLSKRLGMTRTSIVNIEAGRQRTPIHVVWAIADELEVDIASLFPSRSEYNMEAAPMELDSKTIALIETAANGNPRTRRDLLSFIGKAKSSNKE